MYSRTLRLDADIDPIALGARSGLLWAREGFALAGIGEAMAIPYGPGEAQAASETLADLSGPDAIEAPGSGCVAFAALPFDRDLRDRLVVPRIAVGRSADGRRWLTTMGDLGFDDALAEVVAAALGKPDEDLADQLEEPVENHKDALMDVDNVQARTSEALEALMGDAETSELYDLWAETDELDDWLTQMKTLRARLDAA